MASLRLLLFTLALTVSSTAAPLPTFAQTPEEKERAAELFKKGAEAYFKEDFSMAIIHFKEGYELDPNPLFLYNLSLSFFKIGNIDQALRYAERAREAGGLDPETAVKTEARIHAFSTKLHAENVSPRMSGDGVCATDADCLAGHGCNIQTNRCVPVEEPVIADSPLDEISVFGWTGAGLAVLGTGLFFGGIIVDAGLSDDIDRYEQIRTTDPDEAAVLKEDIESSQTTGLVLLYSGLGAMMVGSGLVVYDLVFRPRETQTARVIPSVGADHAGATLHLKF